MNPNAPEHQPSVARDVTVIKSASDKFWSHPDPEITQRINNLVDKLDKLNDLRNRIDKVRKSTGKSMKKPVIPLFSRTYLATQSNICQGTKVNLAHGLHVLNPVNGTTPVCTKATLEYICDYANMWHGLLSGNDYRSPGQPPKFFCLDNSFHKDLMSRTPAEMATHISKSLPINQFWTLRYLFIPIEFKPDPQFSHSHVALCSISPEAKTIDYLCSGGDTGLLKRTPRFDGSKCIPALFCFLAAYTDLTTQKFMPNAWTFRSNASNSQDLKLGYCAQYTTGQAMYLAFGWGLAWPSDHQAKMPTRRKRYVQDLLLHGYKHHDPDPASKNYQYYPLLDTKPTAEKLDHFLELPKEIMDTLPGWVLRRRECYLGCLDKATLTMHCKRNSRFYPGYETMALDDLIGLVEYVQWVEERDWKRKTGTYLKGVEILDYSYPNVVPKVWVDPRHTSKQQGSDGLEEALWQ